MDADIKARWVAALRSGNYLQGRNQLKHESYGEKRYCCLGVLCDIIDPNGWDSSCFDYESDASSFVLPPTLMNKLEISDGVQGELTNMNDCKGLTFSEIADFIEQEL